MQTAEKYASPDRPESGTPLSLPLDVIDENPFQPRLTYDADKLNELASSIRADGLLQPIVVRRAPTIGRFQLVAGHRRLRAFKELRERSDANEERRFTTIPALLRANVGDAEMARLALNENLQRDELTATDAAQALVKYRDMMQLKSAKDVAEAMGLDVNRVKRLLRLHELPPFIKAAVSDGILVEVAAASAGGEAAKRSRRKLDLFAALEFGRFYRVAFAQNPKRAEARVTAAIDKALREAWGLRRVETFVSDQLASGSPEPAEPTSAKTDELPAVKPVFAMRGHVLTVDTARVAELKDAQRTALAALVEALFPLPPPTHAPMSEG